jgi:hypothetical protein
MFGLEPFQSKVVGVACVVLIVMLSLIGYLLAKSKIESKTWPPTIAVCPDYWEDATGTGKHCTNPHNLGRCNIGNYQNTGSDGADLTYWANPKNRCKASQVMKDCHYSWDGISNDDNACASADSKKKDDSSMPSYMTIFLVILVVIALMYLLSNRGKTEGATE